MHEGYDTARRPIGQTEIRDRAKPTDSVRVGINRRVVFNFYGPRGPLRQFPIVLRAHYMNTPTQEHIIGCKGLLQFRRAILITSPEPTDR